LTDGFTTSNPEITAKVQHNIREIRKNMLQQEARGSNLSRSHGSPN
jgi:hypothetical protein